MPFQFVTKFLLFLTSRVDWTKQVQKTCRLPLFLVLPKGLKSNSGSGSLNKPKPIRFEVPWKEIMDMLARPTHLTPTLRFFPSNISLAEIIFGWQPTGDDQTIQLQCPIASDLLRSVLTFLEIHSPAFS